MTAILYSSLFEVFQTSGTYSTHIKPVFDNGLCQDLPHVVMDSFMQHRPKFRTSVRIFGRSFLRLKIFWEIMAWPYVSIQFGKNQANDIGYACGHWRSAAAAGAWVGGNIPDKGDMSVHV